uniref:Ig-like domain-containing protein n=1 Tax=Chrysemys picta bellii TaxID=8478 RepID=A0A8C3FCZ9_CHRPI
MKRTNGWKIRPDKFKGEIRANGEPVTQPDARVTVSQGEPVLLKCTYDPSQSPRLWWYEQYPNEAPRLLLGDYEAFSDEERRSRRGFSATPDKQGKTFHLKKSSSELRDSAVYYCAMSDTVIAPSRVAAQKPAGGREGGTKELHPVPGDAELALLYFCNHLFINRPLPPISGSLGGR